MFPFQYLLFIDSCTIIQKISNNSHGIRGNINEFDSCLGIMYAAYPPGSRGCIHETYEQAERELDNQNNQNIKNMTYLEQFFYYYLPKYEGNNSNSKKMT